VNAYTENDAYWQRVRDRAAALGSDGCTAVSEWNRVCCLHHDIMCRTGMDIDGNAVSRQEADWLYWECNRERSMWGLSWYDPRGYARWIGVRLGAWWDRRKERNDATTNHL